MNVRTYIHTYKHMYIRVDDDVLLVVAVVSDGTYQRGRLATFCVCVCVAFINFVYPTLS